VTGPTIGALFAGYGGLELALAHVFPGARTLWVADNDPAAARVLATRFPGVPNLGDITTVSWPTTPRPDILTGGFPCQDVSHAGRRRGLGPGTRTGLWSRMAAAIEPATAGPGGRRERERTAQCRSRWRRGTLPVVSGRRRRR
jgi:DNA (cytosine-5)-methyltransferase 1